MIPFQSGAVGVAGAVARSVGAATRSKLGIPSIVDGYNRDRFMMAHEDGFKLELHSWHLLGTKDRSPWLARSLIDTLTIGLSIDAPELKDPAAHIIYDERLYHLATGGGHYGVSPPVALDAGIIVADLGPVHARLVLGMFLDQRQLPSILWSADVSAVRGFRPRPFGDALRSRLEEMKNRQEVEENAEVLGDDGEPLPTIRRRIFKFGFSPVDELSSMFLNVHQEQAVAVFGHQRRAVKADAAWVGQWTTGAAVGQCNGNGEECCYW
ncbi:hypothetical protein FOZ61_000710 [Perkinsus olseni]|uniref:Uncharacterized protein n=1 Tax=Perkinsus olseni TaxID=32597 RepID=A0A7J6LZ91_PEROL|nr:hypothetical protein FOZ61_000710 [Perkinsus olseni]